MLDEYKNGCIDNVTFEVYNKIARVNHIFSWAMYPTEDGEVVSFSFNHYGDIFHGKVVTSGLHQSTVATLFLEFDMVGADGDKTLMTDFYGYVEIDSLVTLLKSIPHIDDILVDTSGSVH